MTAYRRQNFFYEADSDEAAIQISSRATRLVPVSRQNADGTWTRIHDPRPVSREELKQAYAAALAAAPENLYWLGCAIRARLPGHLLGQKGNGAVRVALAATGNRSDYDRNNDGANAEALAMVCISTFGGPDLPGHSVLPRDARRNSIPKAARGESCAATDDFGS